MIHPLFVTDPVHILYETGFSGSTTSERDAYLLITKGKTYLFTNSLYRHQAEHIAETIPNMEFVQISRQHHVALALKELIKTRHFDTVHFEEHSLYFREYMSLKTHLAGIKLIPVESPYTTQRQLKTNEEIEKIAEASRETVACFSSLLPHISPGIFEGDIVRMIKMSSLERNTETAFDPIVAFGRHASEPHYVRTGQGAKLEKNDTILIDLGLKAHGYCSDMTRMIAVGTPTKRFLEAYDVVRRAYTSGHHHIEQALKHNAEIKGDELDIEAKNIISDAGFPPYSHSLGHNIGLEIHESPRLNTGIESTLKEGMVFTIEPGIYLPDEFGIRLENTVAIQNNTLMTLCHFSEKLILI